MKENLSYQSKDSASISSEGFTLIELLVTLAIIGIIVPVIYWSFFNNSRIYKKEIKKYESKSDSRVILMEIESCIKNSSYSSCCISETPAKDLCIGGSIVKRLIYIEPVKTDLKPYLLVIKINSNGVKELNKIAVSPDLCSPYKVKTDSWKIESIKEIEKSDFNSDTVDPYTLSLINSCIDSEILQKEFTGLSILPENDPEILTIKNPIEGVKNYYRDVSGRIYASIEYGGKLYKALLKHIKYEKVPYMIDSSNIVLDGINDIRITQLDDYTYNLEVDANYSNTSITYSTHLSTKNVARRVVYE